MSLSKFGWIEGSSGQGPPGPRGLQGPPGPPGPTGSSATATNPVTNGLVVFKSNTVSPPEIKSADAPVTLQQPLTVDAGVGTGNKNVFTVQGETSGGFIQMLLNNTKSGQSGTGITFGQPLVTNTSRTWSINSGATTNELWFWKNSGTFSGNVIFIGDNGVVNTPAGNSSKRYDIIAQTANPGNSTTLWANSTTSNSLQYGTGNVLVNPAPTIANAIPVYTGTGGQVDTTASGTTATIARPITITPPTVTGTNSYGFTVNGTVNGSGRVYSQILNNAPGNSSAGLFLGKPYVGGTSLTWEFGVDDSVNNTDNFYILHNKTTKKPLIIRSDDIVDLMIGVNSSRYDFTPKSSNPGTASTLWVGTDDTSRPKLGANKLALFSDLAGAAGSVDVILTSGSTTVPIGKGYKLMHVFMSGGGGGGGRGATNRAGGGGSGGATFYFTIPIAAVEGKSFYVNLGAGGAGGTNSAGAGGTGGTTYFKQQSFNAWSVAGGLGGNGGTVASGLDGIGAAGHFPGGGGAGTTARGGGSMTAFVPPGVDMYDGDATQSSLYSGGMGWMNPSYTVNGTSSNAYGGGGGGGPCGSTGDGWVSPTAIDIPTTFGPDATYGGGGGGGRGGSSLSNGRAGGQGFVVVWYT